MEGDSSEPQNKFRENVQQLLVTTSKFSFPWKLKNMVKYCHMFRR